ncbi:MAG: ABC-F family ATP-binding cassette domain-containing protein [bacterium]|nr:ABC-F family ATP-binding cassette domain-containing protein [bacterium]
MSAYSLSFNNVSFRYDTTEQFLFKNINLSFSNGWTGISGGNGTGKTTLLKIISGDLIPEIGTVYNNKESLFCEQRMDFAPSLLADFIYSYDRESIKLKYMLNIDDCWLDRWNYLSYGERKRLQIAEAIWRNPLVLLVDEPTNHLDIESRQCLMDLLIEYKGIGIIVSHDRYVMDNLCNNSIFIDAYGVDQFRGSYTKSLEQKKIDDESHINEYLNIKKDYRKLKKEYTNRKQKAAQADNRRSKKHIAKKDYAAKDKIEGGICSGRDAVAGKLQTQLKGRLNRKLTELNQTTISKTKKLDIWIKCTELKKDYIFKLDEKCIELGTDKRLTYPELSMNSSDRIALTGENGSGKTTLINKILKDINVDKEKILFLPQEIDAISSNRLLKELKLNLDSIELAKVMNLVKHLGSEPKDILSSKMISPGEIRKLLLAIGILKNPRIIIMDEPTNHLDLDSIKCLESALYDAPCGMLMISHDLYFLKKLTSMRWHFLKKDSTSFTVEKKYW